MSKMCVPSLDKAAVLKMRLYFMYLRHGLTLARGIIFAPSPLTQMRSRLKSRPRWIHPVAIGVRPTAEYPFSLQGRISMDIDCGIANPDATTPSVGTVGVRAVKKQARMDGNLSGFQFKTIRGAVLFYIVHGLV